MLRPAVSDVSFLYFEPNVICVYEACIGVTHFAVVKLRKQKMSLPHQPEVSLDLIGCVGASYLLCDQIAELWRNDPQLENRACIQRVPPRCSGFCAERERERERERELLLLLPLPRVWPSSKEKSMQPGVNRTSNLIPVLLYHLKNSLGIGIVWNVTILVPIPTPLMTALMI